MDKKEAKEYLDKMYDALFEARTSINSQDNYKKEIERLTNHLKDRDKKIKEINIEKIELNAKLRGYIQNTDFEIEVCQSCNGCGGFDWDDGYGNAGGEECKDCNGTGYKKLDKSHLQTSATQKETNS